MKKFPGFSGFTSAPFGQKWIKRGAIILTAVTLSAGCGKQSDKAVSTPPPQTNVAATQPAAPSADQANQTTPVANQTSQSADRPKPAAVTPTGEPDLTVINRAVRRWLIANQRPPKNFDDFAATAGVSIPPAPAGKKYILTSDMHVKLVNQ